MKKIIVLVCVVMAGSSVANDAPACDREGTYKAVVVFFSGWELEAADISTWHVQTGWRDLKFEGLVHYQITVLVGVAPNCELTVKRWYKKCSQKKLGKKPKCKFIEFDEIVVEAKQSEIAARVVLFNDNVTNGLRKIGNLR